MAPLVSLVLLGIGVAGSAKAAYPGVDGRIAFVRDGNIYTIQSTGAGRQQLTSGGHCSGPRWSPDGDEIAYLYRGNLWIMGADGADKARVTDAAPHYTDARPSWSPNGRYLAFVKTERGNAFGFLTRYDTLTGRFVTFSTPYDSESPTVRQVKVTRATGPGGVELGVQRLEPGLVHPVRGCRVGGVLPSALLLPGRDRSPASGPVPQRVRKCRGPDADPHAAP